MRCLQQKRLHSALLPPPVFRFLPVSAWHPGNCVSEDVWNSWSLLPKTFFLAFSGFQIRCSGVPNFVPLPCKKTKSSMESAFLAPPADTFRAPAFHACNTCPDSFSRSRFCLDFDIRFHAFTSFGVRYKVGSLYSSKYTCISFSICCASSCSIQASQFSSSGRSPAILPLQTVLPELLPGTFFVFVLFH